MAAAVAGVPGIVECCNIPFNAPLARQQAHQLARAFDVLADASRLQILSILSDDGGQVDIGTIRACTGLRQSIVSHHLKVLGEAGLCERLYQGRWAAFIAQDQPLTELANALLILRSGNGT